MKYDSSRIIPVVFVLVLLLVGPGPLAMAVPAGAAPSGYRTRTEAPAVEYTTTDYGEFRAEGIYETSGLLTGGEASGDPDNDGDEDMVVVSWDGRVTMLSYDAGTGAWDSHIIYVDKDLSGSTYPVLDVIIGDFWSVNPGNETLIVGYSGHARILYYENGTWKDTVIYNTTTDMFGLAYGDIDPDHPGVEIAVADWTTANLTILSENAVGGFDVQKIEGPDVLVNVMVGDFDPFRPGAEILCTSNTGLLVEFWINGTGWGQRTVWKDVGVDGKNVLLSNVKYGDFCSYHDGIEVVCVGLSGNATMLYPISANKWYHEILWQSRKNEVVKGIEGVDVGEFDPEHPGDEVLLVGYSNVAIMVLDDGEKMQATPVWKTESPIEFELNGATIDDFLPEHPGNEGIVIGYSGAVTLIRYMYPGFELEPVPGNAGPALKRTQGSTGSIALDVIPRGGFRGQVDLGVLDTVEFLGDDAMGHRVERSMGECGIEIEFQPVSLVIGPVNSSRALANVVIDTGTDVGNYTLTFTAADHGNASCNARVSARIQVQDRHIVEFDLNFTMGDAVLLSEGSNTTVVYTMEATSPYEIDPIGLDMMDVPAGVGFLFSPESIMPGENATLSIIISPNARLPVGYNNLTLEATSGGVSKIWIVPLLIQGSPEGIDVKAFDVVTDPPGLFSSGVHATVTVEVSNIGNGWAHFALVLMVDGEEKETQLHELAPGGSESYRFEIDLEPGDHNVSLKARAGEGMPTDFAIIQDESYSHLTVRSGIGPSLIMAIMLILIALAIFAAIIALYIRGTRGTGKGSDGPPGREGRGTGKGTAGRSDIKARGSRNGIPPARERRHKTIPSRGRGSGRTRGRDL